MKRTGAQLIQSERKRQKESEGYDAEHDDQYLNGELLTAALLYASTPQARQQMVDADGVPVTWPWRALNPDSWKPTPYDRVRELTKAGALIAAEIDRIQRIENEETYWEGKPVTAERCRVIVADMPKERFYWAKPFIGDCRQAVMIKLDGETIFIDDEGCELPIVGFVGYPGWGWHKVTVGRGSPEIQSARLAIERIVETESDGRC